MPMYDTAYVKPPSQKDLLDKEVRDTYTRLLGPLFEDLEAQENEYLERVVNRYSGTRAFTVEVLKELEDTKFNLLKSRMVLEQIRRAAENRAHGPGRRLTKEEKATIDAYRKMRDQRGNDE